jgi:hypothetical protein
MSSYFLGGFSACLIVPSGRRSNQSGVLLDPGMVGRGVQRHVERDLDPVVARCRHQPVEVLQRAQFGMDLAEPAVARADGIGAAHVARFGAKAVVAALAVRLADRVDRREVERVEAEVADVRQMRDHVVEGAVSAPLAEGPREKLVPGTEHRALPVDPERQLARVERAVGPRPDPGHERKRVGVHQRIERAVALRRLPQALERGAVRAGRAQPAQELPRLVDLERHVLSGRDLLRGVVAPCPEEIPPGGDGEAVSSDRLGNDAGGPAVIAEVAHGDGARVAGAFLAQQHGGADDLVAVAEDVGADLQGAALDALGGEAPGIDFRRHGFDGDPVSCKVLQMRFGGRVVSRHIPNPRASRSCLV